MCTVRIKNASTARLSSMFEVPYCLPTIGTLLLFTILPVPWYQRVSFVLSANEVKKPSWQSKQVRQETPSLTASRIV